VNKLKEVKVNKVQRIHQIVCCWSS